MADSGSFVSRNGDKLFLVFALAFVIFAVASSLGSGEPTEADLQIRKMTDDAEAAINKAATQNVVISHAPPTLETDRHGPTLTTLPAGASLAGRADILPPDEKQKYGDLNRPMLNAEKPELGVIRLDVHINMKLVKPKPGLKHPTKTMIKVDLWRAESADPAKPAADAFKKVASFPRISKLGRTRYTDKNVGPDGQARFLKKNTHYFYKARVRATYALKGAEEETLSILWSAVVHRFVEDDLRFEYIKRLLDDREHLIVTTRIEGQARTLVWKGPLGDPISGIDEKTNKRWQTGFVPTDRVWIKTLRITYTDQVTRVELKFNSTKREIRLDLNKDGGGIADLFISTNTPKQPAKVETEDSKLITVSLDPTMVVILMEALAAAREEHARINVNEEAELPTAGKEKFKQDGILMKSMEKMAAGFEPQYAILAVDAAHCPKHQKEEMWAALPKDAPGSLQARRLVYYYCPTDAKLYVRAVGGAVKVWHGPFDLKEKPQAQSDLAAAVQKQLAETLDELLDGSHIPAKPPGVKRGQRARKLLSQTHRLNNIKFLIIAKRDSKTGAVEIRELPR